MTRADDAHFATRALVNLIFPRNQPSVSHKRKSPSCDISETSGGQVAKAQPVLLEKLTMHTISVSWSGAQTGFCGEQIWRLSIARREGSCAATGQAIRRGDRVFTLRARPQSSPFNRNWMILASFVDDKASSPAQMVSATDNKLKRR